MAQKLAAFRGHQGNTLLHCAAETAQLEMVNDCSDFPVVLWFLILFPGEILHRPGPEAGHCEPPDRDAAPQGPVLILIPPSTSIRCPPSSVADGACLLAGSCLTREPASAPGLSGGTLLLTTPPGTAPAVCSGHPRKVLSGQVWHGRFLLEEGIALQKEGTNTASKFCPKLITREEAEELDLSLLAKVSLET